MTAQYTEKAEIENSAMVPKIKKKLSKFGHLAILGDFEHIFTIFSAPLHFFQFLICWCTLCDLCGHFEYNKPIFYEKFFLGLPPWP